MGNWRTVNIEGTCDPADLRALRARLRHPDYGDPSEDGTREWGPLSYTARGSLCGIDAWPAEHMLVAGNLAERDFTVEDVAAELRECAKVAPSLRLVVHCGDDYERPECVATIRVADGTVEVGPPAKASVAALSEDAMRGRVLNIMLGAGGV